MRAMILAAGLGTRLNPITNETPKPLVPVVGVPNIIRIINRLKEAGIMEIVMNLHWLPDVIPSILGDGSSLGVQLAYSREEILLGTGGGIKKALPLLGSEPFLVVNGDALFAPNFADIIDAHRASGAMATMVVREDDQAEAFGAVGLDRENRVRRLVWVGDNAKVEKSYMFTGLQVLEPKIGTLLPDNGCIVRETYMSMLNADTPINGCPVPGYFCDLGTSERYLQANIDLVLGKQFLPGFTPPANGIHLGDGVALGSGCQLLPGTVIGDRVTVAPGVRIARSVVFNGAKVVDDLFGAIVTPRGQVVST